MRQCGSKVCLGWQIKGRRLSAYQWEAEACLDWPMRGWGLPWLTNEKLSSKGRRLTAYQLHYITLTNLWQRWALLTDERPSSAVADQWEAEFCPGWPMRDCMHRLSLAGAEWSSCEGKRFHGVPDLVEEFCHGGHAREMTPKNDIIQIWIWKQQKAYLWYKWFTTTKNFAECGL
jgi:hypothetical protein